MKNRFILLALPLFLLTVSLQAETVGELQEKLQQAQTEIENLKAKISAMQNQVDQARVENKLPPARPLDQALGVEHPIVTAYELASYGETDPAAVKSLLKGKVVSVTGDIERFSEGLGRGYKIFLSSAGAALQIGGSFNPASTTRSTYTAEDGGEMVVDDEHQGKITVAVLHEKVVLSGFFDHLSRRQISLNSCVLQKQ